MMKYLFAVALSLFCTAASAQWQTPNHSTPLGRGGGITGFGSVGPCNTNVPIIGQGAAADPVCGALDLSTAGATGNIPAARFNSGTNASATTFWRGDMSWQAIQIAAQQMLASALGYNAPLNLQINATVAGNNLTIALKGVDGNDPSATNPVVIPFRSATASSGASSAVLITAATSFVINNTNTMGCTSAVYCRLWILALNNGGTAQLCATNINSVPANAATGTGFVLPVPEGSLQSAGSGSANGGSNLNTVYCNTAAVLTSLPMRILGYVDMTEATAGAWATAPAAVQLMGPGISRPGSVVGGSTAVGLNSATTALNTAGYVVTAMTVNYNMQSPANVLRIVATTWGFGAVSAATAQCQIQSNAVALGQPMTNGGGAALDSTMVVGPVMNAPNTTSAVTYALYCRGNGTNTYTIEGGSISVEEIMG